MTYRVEITGLQPLLAKLRGLRAALAPGEVATAAGREIVINYMPALFKSSGFGSWAPLKLRRGTPLSDTAGTAGLLGSWSFRKATGSTVEVFTPKSYAHVHDKGKTIHAKPGKMLWIPNPTYWGNSERKASIRELYARIKAGRVKKKAAKAGEPPFFFAKQVTIPERSMTKVRPEMREAAKKGVAKMIAIAVKKANGA